MLSLEFWRPQVALDELGRGTSTSDGAAIAGAVLEHLTSSVGCRYPTPPLPCNLKTAVAVGEQIRV